MDARIYVIGIGTGSEAYILPAAIEAIRKCKVIFGAKRQMESIRSVICEDVEFYETLSGHETSVKVKEVIGMSGRESSNVAILVSGDTGIFSLFKILRDSFDKEMLTVIPGISALQYFAASIKDVWVDSAVLSMHGRYPVNWLKTICENEKTYIFCGGECTPGAICSKLLEYGLGSLKVIVGEQLSMPGEKLTYGTADEVAKMKFDGLAVMRLEKGDSDVSIDRRLNLCTYGFPDEYFIRAEVPMTKEEVRAIALSKLRLTPESTLIDIGAGTGSVSVEAALLLRRGEVFAVEMESPAVELIKSNMNAFGINNITIVNAEAPNGLENLPIADRIFIGGSGDKTSEIIRWASQRNREAGKPLRVVMNAITIDTVYSAKNMLDEEGFNEIEVIQVSVNRSVKASKKLMLKALNPVYIISAEKMNQREMERTLINEG